MNIFVQDHDEFFTRLGIRLQSNVNLWIIRRNTPWHRRDFGENYVAIEKCGQFNGACAFINANSDEVLEMAQVIKNLLPPQDKSLRKITL